MGRDPGNDGDFADEILDWAEKHYSVLTAGPIIQSLYKKAIGDRFTGFDIHDGSKGERGVHRLLSELGDEWGAQSEQVIAKLLDIAPEAVEELITAVTVLADPNSSAATSAQVAVSLRRCLEKIADSLTPPLTEKEKGKGNSKGEYKYRLGKYVTERLSHTKAYRDYLQSELDELCVRIEKLYNLGNKGIHEDWLRHVFSSVALRLILLAGDLVMPRKVVKPKLIYEDVLLDDE